MARGTIARAEHEDHGLTQEFDQAHQPLAQTSAVVSTVTAQDQKERLKLLKMIYDSKQRQEELQQEASTLAQDIHQKETLINAVKDLQDSNDRLTRLSSSAAAGAKENWNDNEMRQLEIEVRDLQKNHDELEDLLAKMQNKVSQLDVSPDQKNEKHKLQASLDELDTEGKLLKKSLGELREQMVDLDKRKSHLEALLGR